MFTESKVSLLTVLLITAALCFNGFADVSNPNITQGCFRCLCHVYTFCTISKECVDDSCGPYNISKQYWIEAGNVTLPGDDPDRKDAWKACANDYICAQKIMEGYLRKYSKDCNEDGVINCYDYLMINSNGDHLCNQLNQTSTGRVLIKRYEECRTARLLS